MVCEHFKRQWNKVEKFFYNKGLLSIKIPDYDEPNFN